jgi:FkbM family methyltransferase
MLKITEDVSQWNTISTLINWINGDNIELCPFIIDIGANDGKRLSNSWNLIVENNWKGLLVEPIPELTSRIAENYKFSANLDKDMQIVTSAVSNTSGRRTLYSAGEDYMLSSFVVPSSVIVSVNCITPQELFDKYGVNKVGILSVDTEGHDFPILESMIKETKVRPQIIITESWPALVYDNINKQSLLCSEGYGKILHCGENEIFLRR